MMPEQPPYSAIEQARLDQLVRDAASEDPGEANEPKGAPTPISDESLKELFLTAINWRASERIVLAFAELMEWRAFGREANRAFLVHDWSGWSYPQAASKAVNKLIELNKHG